MIRRNSHLSAIRTALERSPIVALIGPRQCGKTTLARELLQEDSVNYFDLEDPVGLSRLDEPLTALQDLRGLVVIDEVQRRPELFPVLRVLADRRKTPSKFLILGSASQDMLRQSSESLAGRMETVELCGFSLQELGMEAHTQHWLRGGFPRSYLASSESDSATWRKNFIQTFLERDLPQWGIRVPAVALRRFWSMLAHYHGQIWNAAEPARSLSVSEPTARRYLDILTGVFMVRQLQPWHVNLKKRQVKSPKLFFRDTGLLHQLMGLSTLGELYNHPKSGASWEGYVIEEVIRAVKPDDVYFWATHQGAEIDLILVKDAHLLGVECKCVDAPRLTPSMRIALQDLGLERIAVLYPGTLRYSLAERVAAVPLGSIIEGESGLFPDIFPSGGIGVKSLN